MGTIMAAGSKGKKRGLEINYCSKITQEHFATESEALLLSLLKRKKQVDESSQWHCSHLHGMADIILCVRYQLPCLFGCLR